MPYSTWQIIVMLQFIISHDATMHDIIVVNLAILISLGVLHLLINQH